MTDPEYMTAEEVKTRTPYTPAEVAALTSGAVAERDRVWATIAFYTGPVGSSSRCRPPS